MDSTTVIEVLRSYPAFRHIKLIKGISEAYGIARLNTFIAVAFGLSMFAAAALDKALVLPGIAVGFLEHPAIFAFLATQCIVPYAVIKGVNLFLTLPDWGQKVLKQDFLDTHLSTQQEGLSKSFRRETNLSRTIYALLTLIGLAAFSWNSISNQDPMRFVGFDFWDSANHVWGYSSTRIYKFYMWCLFFPALLHIEIMMLACMRRLVVSAAKEQGLALEPFHPDRCGGVRAFMDTVLIPLVPALTISSILALSAMAIHKRIDITTGGALALLCATFLALYFMVAVSLRRAIIIEKERQLGLIAKLQHEYFFSLIFRAADALSPEEADKSLSSLSNIASHIRSIPNWPQLRFVLRAASLAGSSPVVAWLAGLLAPKLANFIGL